MITANLTPIQVLEKLQADHRTVRRHFAEYYHAVYLSAQHVFDKLTEKFPHIDDSGENTFTWEFGVHHLYRKISRDLMEKIILGIYSVESWLPSEAKLAKEYGVSVSTIRQALRLLSLLGFIQTAVSYTHLDVYKRQPEANRPGCPPAYILGRKPPARRRQAH